MKNIFRRWKEKFSETKVIVDKEIDLSPPGVEGNIRFDNTRFIQCRFIHSGSWPYSLTNCRFEDCQFVFEGTGRNHSSTDSQFENCTFHFKRASKFMFYHGQRFRMCIFKGHLNDSVFCLNPNGQKYGDGEVSDCDFRGLRFDILEFRGREKIQGTQFSDWPVVTLSSTLKNSKSPYKKDHLPNELKGFFGLRKADNVLVLDLSKWVSDPEELWAVAHDAPFLDFNNKSKKSLPGAKISEALRDKNRRINAIIEKYQSAVRSLVRPQNYLSGVTRSDNDLILHMVDKGDGSHEFEILLKDCKLAEFTGGPFNGTLPTFDKPFLFNGYEIDHEKDVLEFKGPRKTMGRLCLSFREALEHPD